MNGKQNLIMDSCQSNDMCCGLYDAENHETYFRKKSRLGWKERENKLISKRTEDLDSVYNVKKEFCCANFKPAW